MTHKPCLHCGNPTRIGRDDHGALVYRCLKCLFYEPYEPARQAMYDAALRLMWQYELHRIIDECEYIDDGPSGPVRYWDGWELSGEYIETEGLFAHDRDELEELRGRDPEVADMLFKGPYLIEIEADIRPEEE